MTTLEKAQRVAELNAELEGLKILKSRDISCAYLRLDSVILPSMAAMRFLQLELPKNFIRSIRGLAEVRIREIEWELESLIGGDDA